MLRLIGRYVARSDNGQTYQVNEYQEFVDASTKDGSDWIPGMKYCELSDGSKVNYVDDETWKTLDGTIIRRVR
jgi:hypothetical protein